MRHRFSRWPAEDPTNGPAGPDHPSGSAACLLLVTSCYILASLFTGSPHVAGVTPYPSFVPSGGHFMSVDQPPPQTGGRHAFGPQAGSAPFAPPPVVRDRNTLGLVLGVLVAVVVALAYGGFLRGLAHDDGRTTELGFGPLAAGVSVGIAVGKVGGRNRMLPVAATLLTAFAVIFGQLFGTALIESHLATGGSLSVTDIFFRRFGALCTVWTHDLDAKRITTLWIAMAAAFGLAKRFGGN